MEQSEPQCSLEEMRSKDDYDWGNAFGYANSNNGYAGSNVPMRCEGAECSAEPFDLADVALVVSAVAGENDGPPWLCLGRLNDGRWFFLTAGCDYTGWDCHASGQAWVSHDRQNLVQFGTDVEARRRLGLAV